MALIKCPECEKEISDTVKRCPNCGYRIKKKANKRIILTISIIMIILAIGGIGGGIYINTYNNKVAQQAEKDYNDLLYKVGGKTYIYGLIAQAKCYDIGRVWYNSIFEKSEIKYDKYTKGSYGGYNNFDTSINNYTSDNKESLNNLSEQKEELANDMKALRNIPNDKYKDAYNELVVFYGVFSNLVDMATAPSGSYNNYLQSYNSYSQEFENSYNKVKVLIPDIQDYQE